MRLMLATFALCGGLLAASNARAVPCTESTADASWLPDMLGQHEEIRPLLDRASDYRLQILLARWSAEPDGTPCVRFHAYRVGEEYTYPAGAIMPFVAMSAMRQMQESAGAYDLLTRIQADGFRAEREDGSRVTVAREWSSTLDREMRRMSVLSMAQAFNRLFDLVGHQELNERAWSAGYSSVRLSQRMDEDLMPEDNVWSPALRLGPDDSPLIFFPERLSPLVLTPAPVVSATAGRAHVPSGAEESVERPYDFSTSNYVSLPDLMGVMFEITHPEELAAGGFRLAPEWRLYVETLFSLMPSDAGISDTDTSNIGEFPPERYKPMIPGLLRVVRNLDGLRYTSQVGRGFGFTTEVASVENQDGRGFVVVATIYANADGIVNDNRYEYGTISDPFFADLGEVLARQILVEQAPTPPSQPTDGSASTQR
jgi:hypothetical protein